MKKWVLIFCMTASFAHAASLAQTIPFAQEGLFIASALKLKCKDNFRNAMRSPKTTSFQQNRDTAVELIMDLLYNP